MLVLFWKILLDTCWRILYFLFFYLTTYLWPQWSFSTYPIKLVHNLCLIFLKVELMINEMKTLMKMTFEIWLQVVKPFICSNLILLTLWIFTFHSLYSRNMHMSTVYIFPIFVFGKTDSFIVCINDNDETLWLLFCIFCTYGGWYYMTTICWIMFI